MKIERIDVYWARLPLAFVWTTSYGDHRHSDTLLVRMEGGGQHAWGESCPVFIPNYSSEHTLAAFHTVREHMAPRIIGQDIETSRDLHALVADIGLPWCARAWLESAVGGAICAELATLPNFTYPGDIFPSSYFYKDDLGKPEITLSGPGEVAVSRVPGIAQEPDPALLAQWTVEHASFRV